MRPLLYSARFAPAWPNEKQMARWLYNVVGALECAPAAPRSSSDGLCTRSFPCGTSRGRGAVKYLEYNCKSVFSFLCEGVSL